MCVFARLLFQFVLCSVHVDIFLIIHLSRKKFYIMMVTNMNRCRAKHGKGCSREYSAAVNYKFVPCISIRLFSSLSLSPSLPPLPCMPPTSVCIHVCVNILHAYGRTHPYHGVTLYHNQHHWYYRPIIYTRTHTARSGCTSNVACLEAANIGPC